MTGCAEQGAPWDAIMVFAIAFYFWWLWLRLVKEDKDLLQKVGKTQGQTEEFLRKIEEIEARSA